MQRESFRGAMGRSSSNHQPYTACVTCTQSSELLISLTLRKRVELSKAWAVGLRVSVMALVRLVCTTIWWVDNVSTHAQSNYLRP